MNHQRQQFEAWASAPPMECRLHRFGEDSAWPGQYRSVRAQCAWEAWQAATAAAWEEMTLALRSHRCDCQGVEIGSCDNQVELPRPPHMPASEGAASTICVDACLAEEIQALWQQGITTTGCCCGHNRLPGFIGVTDDDIPRMLALGYRVAHNKMRPGDDDSFYPKSTWRES